MTINLYDLGIRQGSLIPCNLLSVETRESIQDGRNLASYRNKPVLDNQLLLILSQDCDLDNERDKSVEVLAIKEIQRTDERLQRTRNYRKLQLFHIDKYLELESNLISIINKCQLGLENVPEEIDRLDNRNTQLVIDWRINRYNRKPLPDNFNRDFLGYLWGDNELDNYLNENRETILDIYVYLEANNQNDVEEYKVTLTALVDEKCDDEEFDSIKLHLIEHLERLHNEDNCLKFGQIDSQFAPETIDINQEIVVRLSDFTFLDNEFFTRITLDYLCYESLPKLDRS